MPLRKYPTITRWSGIDPVTHHSQSTYNAFDGSPVYYADPSGADSRGGYRGLRYDYDRRAYFYKGRYVGRGGIYSILRKIGAFRKKEKAILIASPDQNPKIPSNQKVAKWIERNLGNGNEKVEGAGHAGIVIINGETGISRYFDFGRYKRPDVEGSRGENEGAVRSSKNFSGRKYGLSIPDWDFSKSSEANVSAIVTTLHKSKIFKGYGTIMASLAEGLDYKAMFKYAQEMEVKGYHAFGGYSSSTNCNNPTYCAKFARGVAEAGGFDWSWYVLTGKASVENVNRINKNGIIIIKD